MDERDALHRGGMMGRSEEGLCDRWRDREPGRSEQFDRRLDVYRMQHSVVQHARSTLISTS